MKIYADVSARRVRQLLGDGAMLVWIIVCAQLGRMVYHAVNRLGASGRAVQDAGGGLSRSLNDAAGKADDVPVVGSSLGAPLRDAGRAAAGLAHAGAVEQSAVTRAAVLLGLIVALLPIVLVMVRWLPNRVRWIRTATATARARDHLDDDLLALRALSHSPLWELQRIHPRPGAAYAAGDRVVIASLAQLELEAMGLQTEPATAGA